MSYLATIHRPTSVQHAIKLELLEPGCDCLVLAKANRLEIYRQSADGLTLLHTRTVYGRICMLQRLRLSSSETEHLFIGTDRYVYFTVSWDAEKRCLVTEKDFVDTADKSSRSSETFDRCIMDPQMRYMALLLYDGIVTILPLLNKGKKKTARSIEGVGDPITARISDLFVKSCTFVYPRDKDKHQVKLASLFEDSHHKLCLSLRALDHAAGGFGEAGAVDLENVLAVRNDIELGASHIIPVPSPAYGILVLAETTISYFDDISQDPIKEPLEKATQFVAWTAVDEFRWILGDDYGNLYLLMLELRHDGNVNGWKFDHIGKSSRASVLVYLDDGCVFVGSHQGDSQLIQIQDGRIHILQSISNIAPILDFTIMDMGSRSGEGQTNEYASGQARIVTGSGVFDDGSLRSVRSGVGLEEQGILAEMDLATNIVALRSTPNIDYDDILLVSFISDTRIFQFDADGVIEERIEYKSFSLNEATTFASVVGGDSILQVTTSSVRLIDLENGMVVAQWSDPSLRLITAASANDILLALSIGGQELVVLELQHDLRQRGQRQFDADNQISCLHIPHVLSDAKLAADDNMVIYVGFWTGAIISILETQKLETTKTISLCDDAKTVPRAILIANLLSDATPSLLVAMANGEVITFLIEEGYPSAESRKVTILGTQQVNLSAIPRPDGLSNVFATCENPSLIYGSEGRLVFSAVTAERATCVCPFDAKLYPGAVAIATSEDIRIALVDPERTTHVQTLHIGELVRRIAYSPTTKTFGIGTIRRSLDGMQEMVHSCFRLTDEVAFKELDVYDLNDDELVESVIRADLSEDDEGATERFIVGTTFADESQEDAIRGRILVFSVSTERKLSLITELPVKGACRALGCLDGNIIAALVKTVVVYALRSNHLQKLCTYRTSTAPIDLAIHAPSRQIAIADLMKSVSIVTYTPPTATSTEHKLVETGRHFATVWTTAVGYVGANPNHTWLESDAEGNLTVLFQDEAALTQSDKRRLTVSSEIRLGEMVNRIRPIDIKTSTKPVVIPKAFVATVEGGVYLFGIIGPAYLDLLMRLQNALAPLLVSLGNVPFMRYRGFKSQVREEDEPYRFVDGELLEGFLELDEKIQIKVVEELGESAQGKGGLPGIREMIEGLRRLH